MFKATPPLLFQALTGNQIRVKYQRMAIEYDPYCVYDYVNITAGHEELGDTFDHKFCGFDLPYDTVLAGTEATLLFQYEQCLSCFLFNESLEMSS